MRVRRLPPVLLLHLKRFKYIEEVGKIKKLPYRVSFPMDLKVVNALEECDDADAAYELAAVVVHVGQSPYHGHYVCLVKSGARVRSEGSGGRNLGAFGGGTGVVLGSRGYKFNILHA